MPPGSFTSFPGSPTRRPCCTAYTGFPFARRFTSNPCVPYTVLSVVRTWCSPPNAFLPTYPSISLRSSNTNLLRIPRFWKVTVGGRSYSTCAPRLGVRMEMEYPHFRKLLKAHLFRQVCLGCVGDSCYIASRNLPVIVRSTSPTNIT